jgi:CheY-like chemotaxis protein
VTPAKILIVDDSRVLHKMYGLMLAPTPLVHALDGIEALKCLTEHPDIDLVLLDLNMPHMSGLALLKQMRSSAHHAKTRVIIVSTDAAEGSVDTRRCLEAGAVSVLRKPFRDGDLLQLIAKLEG